MILLDTHVVIWLASEPERLSRGAHDRIAHARRSREGLAIVDITLWELALLWGKGRIQLNTPLRAVLEQLQERFVVRPITAEVCLIASSLPADYPNDPADRILGATALAEDMPFVTADKAIQQSAAGIRTIW